MPESPPANYGPQVLASIAVADKSEPPDWALMQVLMDLEQTIIVRDRNFEGYLALCCQARDLVSDPILKAALELGHFNGLRRIPTIEVEQVRVTASELSETLRKLDPRSKRVVWLNATFAKNAGFLCRDVGDFNVAIQFQNKACEAYTKLGDSIHAAISRFLVAVERFNFAISSGEEVEERLAELDQAYLNEKPTLQSVSWWWVNLPVHILLAHTQANKFGGSDVFNESINYLLNLNGPDAEKSAHWIRLAQGVNSFLKNGINQARSMLTDIALHQDRDRQADITMTANLALGRWLLLDDPQASRAAYQRILNWTGLKGWQVKNVTYREIKRFST